jgi:2-(1,2-epoxy-1,2-dihydrophenyl)acetyl-CoA isomerase
MNTASEMPTTPIQVFVDGGVGHIALNRPVVANAIDLATARSLDAAVENLCRNDRVRVLLITGDGRRFCVGGDLRSVLSSEDPATGLDALVDAFGAAVSRISDVPLPVVCAVQGAVAGAGLALMLACDYVIASQSTKFAMAYGSAGLTPDCGVSWMLPRAVGQQRALDFALTARVLSATEALNWGLINVVVDDGDERTHATGVSQTLAAGPTHALGVTRQLLRSGWSQTRRESMQQEHRTIQRVFQTDDARVMLKRFET